ncbi:MAG: hypothetical protein QM500_04535 [Methylococcales bacterium]
MTKKQRIIPLFGLLFVLASCGGGGDGSGDPDAAEEPDTNTGTQPNIPQSSLECDLANGIVGCWEDNRCVQLAPGFYGNLTLSFTASNKYDVAVDLYSDSSCQVLVSTNKNFPETSFAIGTEITTTTGTTANKIDLDVTGSSTFLTIFDVFNDQLCFPDFDYGFTSSGQGVQFNNVLEISRETDIDYTECLTRK